MDGIRVSTMMMMMILLQCLYLIKSVYSELYKFPFLVSFPDCKEGTRWKPKHRKEFFGLLTFCENLPMFNILSLLQVKRGGKPDWNFWSMLTIIFDGGKYARSVCISFLLWSSHFFLTNGASQARRGCARETEHTCNATRKAACMQGNATCNAN